MLLEMQETQGITPPALERRPKLTAWQSWLISEFSCLSRDRRYTDSGPCFLHTGAIKQYYDAFELHYFDFDDFYSWMTLIDGIWLDEVAKKREREQKASESKAKSTPAKPHKR